MEIYQKYASFNQQNMGQKIYDDLKWKIQELLVSINDYKTYFFNVPVKWFL